jgi:hypothetical protein
MPEGNLALNADTLFCTAKAEIRSRLRTRFRKTADQGQDWMSLNRCDDSLQDFDFF